MLESRGASSEKAAHAHAHERQIIAVYIRPGQGVVHGRGHHCFPVISEREILFALRGALSRAVKGQAVIAPPYRCCRTEIEKFLEAGVESTVEDQCGTWLVRVVHLIEISGQGGALVGNFYRLPSWAFELRRLGIRLLRRPGLRE